MGIGRPLHWSFAVLAGLLIGAGSGWWSTGEGAATRVPGDPSWFTEPAAGSAAANLWTRARIARVGLLALNRKEAMYYIADRDDTGQALREACHYQVGGGALPGAWWSLTLYAQDRFLANNEDQAHSFVARTDGDDPAWHVYVGPDFDNSEGDRTVWLSSRHAGHFSLALRVYRPAQQLLDDPHAIALPRIHRQACAP